MKKYIHIAKCIKPTLTEAACELLADEYANLRSDDFEDGVARTQTVTARALETLIRLVHFLEQNKGRRDNFEPRQDNFIIKF